MAKRYREVSVAANAIPANAVFVKPTNNFPNPSITALRALPANRPAPTVVVVIEEEVLDQKPKDIVQPHLPVEILPPLLLLMMAPRPNPHPLLSARQRMGGFRSLRVSQARAPAFGPTNDRGSEVIPLLRPALRARRQERKPRLDMPQPTLRSGRSQLRTMDAQFPLTPMAVYPVPMVSAPANNGRYKLSPARPLAIQYGTRLAMGGARAGARMSGPSGPASGPK